MSPSENADALDQIVQSFLGLSRVDGKRDERFTDFLRIRELTPIVTAFLKRSRPIQWVIVCADFDTSLVKHRMHEINFVDAESSRVDHDWIQMKSMFAFRHDRGQSQARHIGKS